MRRLAYLSIASLPLIFSTCGEIRRWRSAEEFRTELRCGMTVQQVEALAEKYGTSSFRAVEQRATGVNHAINEGSTVFWFAFDGGALGKVQEGMYFGITGLKTSIREDLCTGEKTADVTLEVTAPTELARASLSIDGREALGLSSGPEVQANIGSLPSGTHEVRIEKPGYQPIVKRYSYTPREYWPDDSKVQIVIRASELKKT